MLIPFLKMHGAGNDFVVIDARKTALPPLSWRKIADRQFGIGCDQIVVLENSKRADVFMRIYNADGSEVGSCGNASRCVGWLVHGEHKNGTDRPTKIETLDGVIEADVKDLSRITIDMGEPRLEWDEIPLSRKQDTLHVDLEKDGFKDPVAVSMGNPHIIFFVDDVRKVALDKIGPVIEHDPLFPKRVNVSMAHVESFDRISLRVWERGSGLTLACGTAACATLVAATRRGLTGRIANVTLPGGELTIEWRESDDHVLMTGPAAVSFQGEFDAESYKP